MHRRDGIGALAGAALGLLMPGGSIAQGAGVKRVGELNPFPPDNPTQLANAKVYEEAMQRLGWTLGRNLDWIKKTGPRDSAGWETAAREIAQARVDAIVVYDGGRLEAAAKATKTIPIVALSGAIVEVGFAQSLARPGGNVTGVVFQAHDENGRVVALLREIRPGLQRIGIPRYPVNTPGGAWFESFVDAAAQAGIGVVALPLPMAPAEVAPMLDAAARERVQALVMPILPFLNAAVWQQITTWAIEHKVVTRGSLLSRGEAVIAFGANVPDLIRLHAAQLDRVLRGAKPAETPILQPTLWDTVINQRLARAVGWPAPQSVLVQATEVIE